MNDKQKETKCIVQPELIKHKMSSPEHTEVWEAVSCRLSVTEFRPRDARGCWAWASVPLSRSRAEELAPGAALSSRQCCVVLAHVQSRDGHVRGQLCKGVWVGAPVGSPRAVCFPRAFSLCPNKALDRFQPGSFFSLTLCEKLG